MAQALWLFFKLFCRPNPGIGMKTEKNKKEKGRVLHRKWEGGKSANFEKKDKNM